MLNVVIVLGEVIQDGTDIKVVDRPDAVRSPRGFLPIFEGVRSRRKPVVLWMIRPRFASLLSVFSSWANRVCFAPFQGDPVDETLFHRVSEQGGRPITLAVLV